MAVALLETPCDGRAPWPQTSQIPRGRVVPALHQRRTQITEGSMTERFRRSVFQNSWSWIGHEENVQVDPPGCRTKLLLVDWKEGQCISILCWVRGRGSKPAAHSVQPQTRAHQRQCELVHYGRSSCATERFVDAPGVRIIRELVSAMLLKCSPSGILACSASET